MNAKDAYITRLKNTIKDLQNQVSSLTEITMPLRKDKFISSSEKTPSNEIREYNSKLGTGLWWTEHYV